MGVVAPHRPIGRRPAPRRSTRRRAAAIGLGLVLLTGVLWWSTPSLLAPVEDFAQGPGGAVAYVSVTSQIRDQSAAFWAGGDVHIQLDEAEFSGMLSSALLSGRGADDPIRRVRGGLADGEITVETVVTLPYESVPRRLRGPLGLRMSLRPVVAETGLVQFQIVSAHVGRVPVPPALIRWAGRTLPVSAPGFDPGSATISLPLGDMVSQALGRRLEIKRFSAVDGLLELTVAMQISDRLN